MSEFISDISKHLKVTESEAAFRTGLDNVKDFLVRVILILVCVVSGESHKYQYQFVRNPV